MTAKTKPRTTPTRTPDMPCNLPNCPYAGPADVTCSCSCGGRNHGKGGR